MWCWLRLLRDSWAKFRTNNSEGNELGKPREFLRSIEERRWRLIEHTKSRKEGLHHRILEGKVEGEIGRGRPRKNSNQ